MACVRPSSLFSLSRVGSWLRGFGTFGTVFQSLVRLSYVGFDFILPKFFKNHVLEGTKRKILDSSFSSLYNSISN